MKTLFMFSGQGAQYAGMGKDLYENFAVAKDIFDKYFNLAAAPQDTAAPTAEPAQTDNGLLR